jgi:hypothetical protein
MNSPERAIRGKAHPPKERQDKDVLNHIARFAGDIHIRIFHHPFSAPFGKPAEAPASVILPHVFGPKYSVRVAVPVVSDKKGCRKLKSVNFERFLLHRSEPVPIGEYQANRPDVRPAFPSGILHWLPRATRIGRYRVPAGKTIGTGRIGFDVVSDMHAAVRKPLKSRELIRSPILYVKRPLSNHNRVSELYIHMRVVFGNHDAFLSDTAGRYLITRIHANAIALNNTNPSGRTRKAADKPPGDSPIRPTTKDKAAQKKPPAAPPTASTVPKP